MEKYYYPDGSLIAQDKSQNEQKKAFIEFYSIIYYYVNKDLNLERNVEQILWLKSKGIALDRDQLMNILLWKMGKRYYNHLCEKEEKEPFIDKLLETANKIDAQISEKMFL